MTNKELQNLFSLYNELFFHNRIPKMKVSFGELNDDEDGICFDDEIIICKTFRKHPNVAILTLGHEMVHAFLIADGYKVSPPDDHNVRFHAEIDRLYRAGFYENLL